MSLLYIDKIQKLSNDVPWGQKVNPITHHPFHNHHFHQCCCHHRLLIIIKTTHQADRLSTEDETIGGYRDCSDGGRLSHQGGCQNHNFCGDDDKEEHKDGDLYDEESSMMTRINMTSIRTAKYLRCE